MHSPRSLCPCPISAAHADSWQCAARTITAPLDRAKLLLQTGGGLQQGSLRTAARQGVWPALVAIGREEGLRGYWKGNMPQARPQHTGCALTDRHQSILCKLPHASPPAAELLPWLSCWTAGCMTARDEAGVVQAASAPSSTLCLQLVSVRAVIASMRRCCAAQILRVIPYSSIQLGSYELLKRWWADRDGRLTLPKRLAAGASAGMIATLVRWMLHHCAGTAKMHPVICLGIQ